MWILWIMLLQNQVPSYLSCWKKDKIKKVSKKVCMGWALSMKIVCPPSCLKVCRAKWGTTYSSFLTLLYMWGKFLSLNNHMKYFGQRFLIATHFYDSFAFWANYEKCQRSRSLSSKNIMSLTPILVCEIFAVSGIEFMGPFPPSYVLHISFWWWTVFPHGWRLSPSILMILKLLRIFLKKRFSPSLAL